MEIEVTASIEQIINLVILIILLCLSGFFSGSETAFFNLSRKQSILLKTSTNKVYKLGFFLLSSPKKLLTALLFGNMIVNVLFFAISSTIAFDIDKTAGPAWALCWGGASFLLLILFGEMLPKSIAYANSMKFSVIAAIPCYLLMKILLPLALLLDLIIIEPLIRIILSLSKRKDFEIKLSHIKMLVDISSRKGSITADENQLISEILELSFLKVKHVMRPRVDMTTCGISSTAAQAIKIMTENSIKKLPVYEETFDNIVGVVSLRDAMLHSNLSLREIMKPVHFIPETKSLESTIEFFKSKMIDLAVIVDEYGGISGLLTMKDIINELLGTKAGSVSEMNITQIGPLEYQLSGNLPMHDWADAFDLHIDKTRYATIGGFVTAMLGDIPKPHDTVNFKNIIFIVDEVSRYRIKKLRIKLLNGAGQ